VLFKGVCSAIGICLFAWTFYLKHRSEKVLSTTEWVRLMRENEAKMCALHNRTTAKAMSAKAKA
jgi:hypothetical protein